MISVKAFFDPEKYHSRAAKWIGITLTLLLGVGLFLVNLNDLIVYEKASKEPTYVQAAVSVTMGSNPNRRYVERLSYEYSGVEYKDIFYASHPYRDTAAKDGEVISVAINPETPGELLQYMVNFGFVYAGIIVTALGLALLTYGIICETSAFQKRRRTYGQKNAYGKPLSHHQISIILLFGVFLAVEFAGMCIIFPNATGLF